MASLFNQANVDTCRLLDAGAGIGSLSGAFLERCVSKELEFNSIHLTECEIDEVLISELRKT
ncbi:MAG TPA: SAM-dependent methyltransferase, partial [Gammaproteobacteria bacterium]